MVAENTGTAHRRRSIDQGSVDRSFGTLMNSPSNAKAHVDNRKAAFDGLAQLGGHEQGSSSSRQAPTTPWQPMTVASPGRSVLTPTPACVGEFCRADPPCSSDESPVFSAFVEPARATQVELAKAVAAARLPADVPDRLARQSASPARPTRPLPMRPTPVSGLTQARGSRLRKRAGPVPRRSSEARRSRWGEPVYRRTEGDYLEVSRRRRGGGGGPMTSQHQRRRFRSIPTSSSRC